MPKVAVRFAESAIADLESIRCWYAGQGVPAVGERLLGEIVASIEALADQPDMGRIVREFGQPFLRELVEGLESSVDIRPWTTRAACRYGPLRAELDAVGKPLGSLDLLIAAHALAEGCTLVTADRAFTNVPGLQVEPPD
jgi:predicted nucleic acid-binding protein